MHLPSIRTPETVSREPRSVSISIPPESAVPPSIGTVQRFLMELCLDSRGLSTLDRNASQPTREITQKHITSDDAAGQLILIFDAIHSGLTFRAPSPVLRRL